MRYFLFSLAVLLLFSCSKDTYEVEDQLYDCLLDRAENENIYLTDEVMELERYYVRFGVLSNYSGKAKIDVYKEILRTGKYPYLPRGLRHNERLLGTIAWFNKSECIKELKDVDKSKSKYLQFLKKLQAHVHSGVITPKQEAKAILDVLNAEDFEHPFFRVYFIVTMNVVMEEEVAKMKSISKNPAPNTFSSSNAVKQSLVVAVADNGDVWIDQYAFDLSRVHSQMGEKFSEITTNLEREVRVISSSDSTNKVLRDVSGSIKGAYRTLLDELSKAQYGKPYYAITDAQRETLIRENPLKIKYEKP